jgi:hypothetical protein
VSYPTITASEALTGGESDATTNDATFNGCFPVGPGPTSATSSDVPPFVSSGTFPVGVTTLYCTGSDNFDGQPGLIPAYQYQKVTVADQPVTLTVPPTPPLARATSSSGATVSYSPVAAEGSEAESVGSCSADKPTASSADGFVSGGNFPVGGTTLTCYATDKVDGTPTGLPPTSQSFTVIVTKTPCAALAGCNLHGLDLSNAILAGADLSSGTDLSNANLNMADLSGASLSFANLSFANLSRANLNRADLTGANLTGANLNQADLTGANLTGANLTGANLTNAKLDGVTWNNTTCPDGTNSNASTPQICVVSGTMTIGNYPPWNGSLSSGFGVSGAPSYFTPTMGQTVTVPPTDTVLHSFTVYADLPANLLFRGEVYAWNPTTVDPANPYALGSATGSALYESGQMHTTSYGSGSAPQPITFNIPGGLPLTAGAQYVLFFTTSRDFAANAAAGITDTGFVGYTLTDTYSGGDLVYVDDGGDPGQWITKGWTHPASLGCPPCFNQDDLAFTAIFSSH